MLLDFGEVNFFLQRLKGVKEDKELVLLLTDDCPILHFRCRHNTPLRPQS
jgi:hypothetical protein